MLEPTPTARYSVSSDCDKYYIGCPSFHYITLLCHWPKQLMNSSCNQQPVTSQRVYHNQCSFCYQRCHLSLHPCTTIQFSLDHSQEATWFLLAHCHWLRIIISSVQTCVLLHDFRWTEWWQCDMVHLLCQGSSCCLLYQGFSSCCDYCCWAGRIRTINPWRHTILICSGISCMKHLR